MLRPLDYRENQKRCQQNWQSKNPDYHSKYRVAHPEYVERNRLLQAGRNAKRGRSRKSLVIAKMYPLNRGFSPRGGAVCRLVPQGADLIAKMYPLTVRIVPVRDG